MKVGFEAVKKYGTLSFQIYYPDTFPEARCGSTPKTSGLDIRVVEGMKIEANKRNDLRMANFTQTDDADGSRSVRFSVETDASEITIQVNGLVSGNTATFHISADDVASDGALIPFFFHPLLPVEKKSAPADKRDNRDGEQCMVNFMCKDEHLLFFYKREFDK